MLWWWFAETEIISPDCPRCRANDRTNPHPPHALTFSSLLITLTEALAWCSNFFSKFQEKFGYSGSDGSLKMFTSEGDQKSLFKDSTKCLQEVPAAQTYQEFLGNEYITSINSLHECSESKSGKNNNNNNNPNTLHHYSLGKQKVHPPLILCFYLSGPKQQLCGLHYLL